MNRGNRFYGHRRILADYVGASRSAPIWGYLQHGWTPEAGVPIDAPWMVRFLPKFVWSSRNRDAALQGGVRNVVPIGAPFLYLLGMTTPRTSEPSGAIFYPFHGWEFEAVEGSHHELIAAIRERERGHVTVCLYWLEYDQAEIRRRYEEAGFRVICHGGKYDEDFPHRQLEELQRHARVVSNRAATALFYGAALGREVDVYGPMFRFGGSAEEEAAARQRHEERWPELLSGGLGGEGARELAERELGAEHLRAPEELAELLGWSGIRGRTGRAVRPVIWTAENVLERWRPRRDRTRVG